MGSAIYDSVLFRDLFGTEQMRKVFQKKTWCKNGWMWKQP